MNESQPEPHWNNTNNTDNTNVTEIPNGSCKQSLRDKLFILMQHALPRVALSRAMGIAGDCTIPWLKNAYIDAFCRYFPVDLREALEENPHAYPSFNHFFSRALKPSARPISSNKNSFLSPCDGTLLTHGRLSTSPNATSPEDTPSIRVKGHTFSLKSLLADEKSLLDRYAQGYHSIIYLAPHNYHRIHMPQDGKLLSMIHVPGTLFSVNDTTVSGVPGVFARNERVICTFETPHGLLTLILVGALIVGSIATTWAGIVTPRHKRIARYQYPPADLSPESYALTSPAVTFQQGEEMGRFLMGSTVITLSESSTLAWNKHVTPGSEVRLGQTLGQWPS